MQWVKRVGMDAREALRILQVIPTLEAGGAERTTVEVAQAISRAGGCAMVATRGGRMEVDLAQVGGLVTHMPVQSKNPGVILLNAQRLARLTKRANLKLIHARSRAPAWSAWWAARAQGLPFVTTYHGIYLAKGPIKRFFNAVMARGDIVIAPSDYARQHILAEHAFVDPARVVTIPRGVDLEAFDPGAVAPDRIASLRRAWGLASDDRRTIVLVPARLSPIKGQQTVIEAAAKVEAAGPGRAVFILAGDAQGRLEYVAKLDAAIASCGVTDVVRRVGHVRDMPAALAAAAVGVFPSLVPESFGRTAVEAQAMGMAVIAADLGGQSETILNEKTGILFPAGEANALAAALERVLAMPADARRAMGDAAMARARALYSAAALQEATLGVYRRLLGVSA
jgi:glycosyltransferase involved in cell wall biosynthesis